LPIYSQFVTSRNIDYIFNKEYRRLLYCLIVVLLLNLQFYSQIQFYFINFGNANKRCFDYSHMIVSFLQFPNILNQ